MQRQRLSILALKKKKKIIIIIIIIIIILAFWLVFNGFGPFGHWCIQEQFLGSGPPGPGPGHIWRVCLFKTHRLSRARRTSHQKQKKIYRES